MNRTVRTIRDRHQHVRSVININTNDKITLVKTQKNNKAGC